MTHGFDADPNQQPGTLWCNKHGDPAIVVAILPPGVIFGSVGCCRTLSISGRIVDEGSWRVKFEGETLLDAVQACSRAT